MFENLGQNFGYLTPDFQSYLINSANPPSEVSL
jgi:hypothetical protein